MTKLLKSLIGLILIVGIIAVLVTAIAPLVKDEILSALGGLFSPSTAETTLQEGDPFEIPVRVYQQDPESGEYHRIGGDTSEFLRVGESKTYTFEEKDDYDIDQEKSKLFVDEPGDVIEVYYTCETCKVSFDSGNATITDGYAIQTVRKGQTPPEPTFFLKGYTCVGYDKPLAPVYEDTTFTARFEKTKYSLYLYATNDTLLPDGFTRYAGADGCFEAQYTFEDTLPVPTPQSDGYTFIEWNTSPDGKGEKVTAIDVGTYESTSLYAIYTVKLYSISFTDVEGVSYPTYYRPYDTVIHAPTIAPENDKAGYGLSWYTDASCTALYDFRTMPKQNLTLYGRWEKDTGTGFLTWSEDSIAQNTVDSREELTVLLDYVRFHNLTSGVTAEITYANKSAIGGEISAAETLGEFRASGSIAYTVTTSGLKNDDAKCAVTIRVSTDFRDKEAKRTTTPTDERAYTYLTAPITPRGEDYDDFYIDKLTKSYAVSTSNQLLYVVEHGYRPIPVKNSPAEKVYLAAKELLNEILPENASHFEKAELIFNYLITNITYDDNAVAITEANASLWPEYDAFYLEGVFFEKKAVCDGISSAFSLLCNIEGIPAVKVLGPNHAWNRVKIDNRWYVADPTFGNVHLSGKAYSIADHSQFLISDEAKANGGYPAQNYRAIVAEQDYGYFAHKTVTHNGRSFDYEINSAEELARLLEFVTSLSDDLKNSTVNFIFAISDATFEDTLEAAEKIMKQRGVTLPNKISYYGDLTGGLFKIVFLDKK